MRFLVSAEYFCNLDANLLRLDQLQRPELNKGTVDFDVTSAEDYWAQHPPPRISQPFYCPEPTPSGPRRPSPIDYIFAFDVSTEAIYSEFLSSACETLKSILFGGTDAGGSHSSTIPESSRIGILTFDTTLHFYDFSVRHPPSLITSQFKVLTLPQSDLTKMLVVADLDEVFVPRKYGLFVNPVEKR